MTNKIIIIGAGPAGLSLACSLASTKLEIILIEKQSLHKIYNPIYDGREIALTHLSKHILEKLNAWKFIPSNQISTIKEAKVFNGNSHYSLNFDTTEIKKNILGYLVANNQIKKALYKVVKTKKNIKIISNTNIDEIEESKNIIKIKTSCNKKFESPLVIAADSRFSTIRKKMNIDASVQNFNQTAIVCKMSHKKTHQNIAYECFLYGETLAVLPLHNKSSSIVLTCSKRKSETLMNFNNNEFNEYISDKFKNKLGDMKLISKRFNYPLIGVYAKHFVQNRFALIGDAAVGMHPVTAHGFNLGIRGQNILSERIKFALKNSIDIGSIKILKKYEEEHRFISKPLYIGTNNIVKLFTKDSLVSKILRKVVLRVGNNLLPVKKKIINSLTELQ